MRSASVAPEPSAEVTLSTSTPNKPSPIDTSFDEITDGGTSPSKTADKSAPSKTDDYNDYVTEEFCCCGVPMLQEGIGFFTASFAKSPSVILAALVGPLTLILAEHDSNCGSNPLTGFTTGLDGQQCTAYGEFGKIGILWNETLWRQLNGTQCGIYDSFGGAISQVLSYDIGLASNNLGCATALSAYRQVTGFTCNCTGDYAFLENGLRPGVVLTISTSIYYLIMVFVAPIIGAIADVTPHRKRLWAIFAVVYSVSIFSMALLGTGYFWVISLTFGTIAGPAYDIMSIPINAYLPELHHKEIIRAKYAGFSTGANYAAQFFIGIIMSILTLSFKSSIGSTGVAQLSCIVCGIWIVFFTVQSYKRMGPRAAGHPKDPNVSIARAAFKSISTTTKKLYNEHPVAFRYLCTNVFGSTGIVVNIALLTTYLVVQMKMDGAQIILVYLLVMSTGAPMAASYGKLNKTFGAKKLYIFIMLFAMTCNGVVPYMINQPNQVYAVYIFAPIAGAYFGLFFAMQSVILSAFIPIGEEAGCYGLLAFSSSVCRWIPPLIYSAIVQRFNDHRLALLHICGFYFIAAILITTVDFEKGIHDVKKQGKERAKGTGGRSPKAGKVLIPGPKEVFVDAR